jgi:hypothetical protein
MASPPSKKPIEKPPETDVETSYYSLTGVRSRNSSAEWLVNDAQNSAIVANSMADIFLEAGATMQMISATHMHNISSKNTQFYKAVDRQVKGNQDVLIGDDNKIHINGSQTVDVVGSHSINIGKKQTVVVGGGQTVTVAGGNRTMDVLSGGFETEVAGKLLKQVGGNYFPTYIGKKSRLFNNSLTEQDQGDFFGTKLSTELSITASAKSTFTGSGEASAMTGASAKFEKSNVSARTAALKHEIFFGGEHTFAPVQEEEESAKKLTIKQRQKKVMMLSKNISILQAKGKKKEKGKIIKQS